jgi:hypothetical protein
MARDTSLTIYVEQDTKDQLRREAEDRDLSLSDYCLGLIDRARKEDAEDDLAESLDAEGRLLSIAAEATDQIEQSTKRVEDVARAIEEIQARTGTYAIANFELLGQSFPDANRRQALTTGRSRVRTPFEKHDIPDLNATSSSSNSSSSTGTSDRTSSSRTSRTQQGSTDSNATAATDEGDEDDDDDVFDRLGD